MLGSRVTAGVLLAAFWLALVLAWRGKGLTDDEANHALGGYTYWTLGDYRINPENGNLPQRVAGLGLVAGGIPAPAIDLPEWSRSDEWTVSHRWATGGAADTDALLRCGRAAMALLAVALVALTWAWARRLFGPEGAGVSLLLGVGSPMLLANGPLITSDTAAALFFLGATGAYWRLLHRVTPWTVLLAGAATAGLFLSKMSAVLLVPIATVLLVARLGSNDALPVTWWRRRRELATRAQRAFALVAATAAQALVAGVLIWAAYGFRFAAFAPGLAAGSRHAASFEQLLGDLRPYELLDEVKLTDAQTERAVKIFRAHGATSEDWTPEAHAATAAVARDVLEPAQRAQLERRQARPRGAVSDAIAFCHRHRLLPEAFLVGTAHARHGALARVSFLDGEVRPTGEPDYFPRTLLYKNPAAVFGLVLFAAAAAWAAVRRGEDWRARLYATLPLWTLLGVYWAVLLQSGINIGHRHALPVYAPCFILCGAAAAWWRRDGGAPRWAGGAVAALLALATVETAWRWPNYTSFFSAVLGGPAQGYRHLADSSVDWGQELPAVKRYLDRLDPAEPAFFSYFGNDSPRRRGIGARLLPSFGGWDNDRTPVISYHKMPLAERRGFLAELAAERPEFELLAEAEEAGQYECAVVKRSEHLRLTGGTYVISAPMLPSLDFDALGLLGPWCARHEREYQESRAIVAPLLVKDPTARQAMLDKIPLGDVARAYRSYDQHRFRRLTTWLRKHREPDDVINGSVLVFKLTGDEIQEALEGPPPELGRDLFMEYRAVLLKKLEAEK